MTPEGRYLVNPQMRLTRRIEFVAADVDNVAVAGLSVDNEDVVETLHTRILNLHRMRSRTKDIISRRLANQTLNFSLQLKSAPLKKIHDFPPTEFGADGEPKIGSDIIADLTLPQIPEMPLPQRIRAIQKFAENYNYIYDLSSSYEPRVFGALAGDEKQRLLKDYFTAIKSRLLHNGVLLVQLSETDPKTPEQNDLQQNDPRKTHNEAIRMGIAQAGFDIFNCDTYPYQLPNNATGTLYVFKQSDYAVGEHTPEVTTAQDIPAEPELVVPAPQRELVGTRR